MNRSIRWTLLLGHALILGGVMAAFGGLLYWRVRESTLNAPAAELAAQARTLASSMEPRPDGRFELILSDAQSRYFQTTGDYVIWDPAGKIVDFTSAKAIDPGPREVGTGIREENLEVVMAGPVGTRILVIRSIHEPLEGLRELLGVILAFGLLVFAVGFGGGWFLVGRILNPLQRITRTASSISETNLSSRIDAAATEDELGDLARTLNSAFDRLEEAMVRQNRFSADASHELRTPLSVLMTQMELALRKERSPSEYREVLEVCLRAVRRMTSLAEGLLFLARADAKGIALQREPLDLRDVVLEAVESARPLAGARGVPLSVDAQSFRMSGDRIRLGEAVTNLVVNALQYNRPEGRVEITLKEGLLAVSDGGPGIPEEDRPHIFERFFRADQARSRNAGGAGLGLAITKWIVEAHGGSIDFTARPGGGTTFRIRFQAAELYSKKRM